MVLTRSRCALAVVDGNKPSVCPSKSQPRALMATKVSATSTKRRSNRGFKAVADDTEAQAAATAEEVVPAKSADEEANKARKKGTATAACNNIQDSAVAVGGSDQVPSVCDVHALKGRGSSGQKKTGHPSVHDTWQVASTHASQQLCRQSKRKLVELPGRRIRSASADVNEARVVMTADVVDQASALAMRTLAVSEVSATANAPASREYAETTASVASSGVQSYCSAESILKPGADLSSLEAVPSGSERSPPDLSHALVPYSLNPQPLSRKRAFGSKAASAISANPLFASALKHSGIQAATAAGRVKGAQSTQASSKSLLVPRKQYAEIGKAAKATELREAKEAVAEASGLQTGAEVCTTLALWPAVAGEATALASIPATFGANGVQHPIYGGMDVLAKLGERPPAWSSMPLPSKRKDAAAMLMLRLQRCGLATLC